MLMVPFINVFYFILQIQLKAMDTYIITEMFILLPLLGLLKT